METVHPWQKRKINNHIFVQKRVYNEIMTENSKHKLISILLSCFIVFLIAGCDSSIPEAKCSITFNANGGSWTDGTEVVIEVPQGSLIWDSRPEVPKRSGFNFCGWFSDKAATKPYDPNSIVSSDTVLYAGWSRHSVYRVEFDTDGGSTLAPQLVSSGNRLIRPDDPEKEGYIFYGWSLDGSDILFDFETPIRSNITLHAVWKEARNIAFAYDLPSSLDGNVELSALPSPETIEDGKTIESPAVSLSYNGTSFRFLGWFEKDSNEPFDFSSAIDRDITLYAKWEEYAISGTGEYIVYSESGLLKWADEGSGKSCTLIADIKLSADWIPIGSEEAPYNTIFDGNNHKISVLRISGDEDYHGFFGFVGSSGIVKNLTITEIEIYGSDSAGGIAGENLGRIENCHTYGTIQETGIAGGGIAGRNRGTIANCSSDADLKSFGDAGGISGVNYGILDACSASGTISGEYAIGGVSGLNLDGGSISSALFSGQIADGYYAGGIAGCNDTGSTISECSFTGRINDMDWYIGGIAGLNSQSSVIEKCSSSGEIIGISETGGIVGHNYAGFIYASSFSGTLSSETIGGGIAGISMGPVEACYFSGTVECNDIAGGIVGTNQFYKITACYSTGKISGNTTVGSIAGQNERGTITACYWQNESTLSGTGLNHSETPVDIHRVPDEATWEEAMTDMNRALSDSKYAYSSNTGDAKMPLIILNK